VTALDNSKIIEHFVPIEDDGDTFVYTETLDRTAKKGNNGHRLVKTFYHRSRAEFWEQLPVIKELCEMTKVRAYTRLAPRSFEKVGKAFTQLVVEAAMQGNWNHMKSLYNSACGRTPPTEKLWLFDVDVITNASEKFGEELGDLGVLRGTIPSRKGLHYITVGFDLRRLDHERWQKLQLDRDVTVHKDNPTNLYIPEGAA
jgi:hypothetical protein